MTTIRSHANKGFTLVELLVTLAMLSIILTGIYSSHMAQKKVHDTQQEVVLLQQSMRAAMYVMKRELRMAGYDYTGGSYGAGVKEASEDKFSFTLVDDDGEDDDPGTLATVTYDVYTPYYGKKALGREYTPNSKGSLLDNLEALNFVYLDSNLVETSNLGSIRHVEVTMVARTDKEDPNYEDTNVYKNRKGDVIFTPPEDDRHYRRRILSTRLRCRNLGLNSP